MKVALGDVGQAGRFLPNGVARDVHYLVNRIVRNRAHFPKMGHRQRLGFRQGVVPVVRCRPGGAQPGPESRVGGGSLRGDRQRGYCNVIGVPRQAVRMKSQQGIGAEPANFANERGHSQIGIDGTHPLVGPSENDGLDAQDCGGVKQFSLSNPGQLMRFILLRDTERAGIAPGGDDNPNGVPAADGLDECSGGAVRFIVRMGKDGEEATEHDEKG